MIVSSIQRKLNRLLEGHLTSLRPCFIEIGFTELLTDTSDDWVVCHVVKILRFNIQLLSCRLCSSKQTCGALVLPVDPGSPSKYIETIYPYVLNI